MRRTGRDRAESTEERGVRSHTPQRLGNNPAGNRFLRQGYPKRIRLYSRNDIDRVFREGQYRRLGILHSKALATGGVETRFLISVKKKIGKAHERNRIKRLVREAVRFNGHRLRGTYDICLFLVKPPPGNLGLAAIETEIRELFDHLNQSTPIGSHHAWGSSSSG